MNKKTLISIFILFLTTLSTFIYTVNIRKPWFGKLSEESPPLLTAVTVVFAKNWIREGPLKLRFGMFRKPKSIEFKDLRDRYFYPSYPSGMVVPIYILGKLFPNKSLVKMTMAYNLLNHFLIAFFLSMTIFFFLLNHLNMDRISATIFSLIPIFLELLLPGPLYWHQNVFFTDEAVILPFVLVVFLEVIKDSLVSKRKTQVVNILQGLTFFYGAFTNWLMYLVGLVMYLKRFFHGKLGKSIRDIFVKSFLFWSPLILALCIHLAQVFYYNSFGHLMFKFLLRMGLFIDWKLHTLSFEEYYREYLLRNIIDWYSKNVIYLLIISLAVLVFSLTIAFFVNKLKTLTRLIGIFLLSFIWGSGLIVTTLSNQNYTFSFKEYWVEIFEDWYGVIAGYLLFLSFAIFLLGLVVSFFIKGEVKVKKILLLMGIFLLPCFLYLYILKGHSITDQFSSLKFSIPISTVIFVLLPLSIFYFLVSKINIGKLHQVLPIFAIIMLICSFLYLYNSPKYEALLLSIGNYIAMEDYTIEKFISKNTSYEDVVFSSERYNSIDRLSYSMKMVHEYQSPHDILLYIAPIKEDCIVNILTINDKLANQKGFIKKIRVIADSIVVGKEATLYKINKNNFTKLLM